MVKNEKLIKLSYYDNKAETNLEVYTDTIIMESVNNITHIAAVRFGGYPEMVRGMSDAIFGGGSVAMHIAEKSFFLKSYIKQYRREFSHDSMFKFTTHQLEKLNKLRKLVGNEPIIREKMSD